MLSVIAIYLELYERYRDRFDHGTIIEMSVKAYASQFL